MGQLELDRLGRSLEHLIELSKTLHDRSVDLVVLDQGIDTSTAVGRMFFHILGSIAEFTAGLISEGTREAWPSAALAQGDVARQLSGSRAVRGNAAMSVCGRDRCRMVWNAPSVSLPDGS